MEHLSTRATRDGVQTRSMKLQSDQASKERYDQSLEVVKNRRKSLKVNLAKKITTIKTLIHERKSRRAVELTINNLKQYWSQLINNQNEFEKLCVDDEERKEADTWILETQEYIEQIKLEVIEYLDEHADETVSKLKGLETSKKVDEENSRIESQIETSKKVDEKESSIGGQIAVEKKSNDTKSVSHSSSRSSSSSLIEQKAREADLARLQAEQLRENAQVDVRKAELAAAKAKLDSQRAINNAEREATRLENEVELLQRDARSRRWEDLDTLSYQLPKDMNRNVKFESNESLLHKQQPPVFSTPWMGAAPTAQEKVEKWMKSTPLFQTEERSLIGEDGPKASHALSASLPKIKLPTFDGDPLRWPEWWGLYKALVDEQRISTTQKMVYLKSSLTGTAERAISGMLFDGSMYAEALKELQCRFGNPRLISKTLMKSLVDLPKLQGENTSSLRSFADKLHNVVRTLKNYGHDADLKAATNLEQVLEKLPSAVAERWSRKRMSLETEVGLEELDEWLEKEVEIKELTYGTEFTALRQTKFDSKSKPQNRNQRVYQARTHVVTNESSASIRKSKCPICQGNHSVIKCDCWTKAETVTERWNLATTYKLCFSCLDGDHRREQCPKNSRCGVEGCDRHHHPQLHKKKKESNTLDPSAKSFVLSVDQAKAGVTVPGALIRPAVATSHTASREPSEEPRGRVIQTLPIILIDKSGNKMKVNAFLDGGSGSSYIRKEVADALGLDAAKQPLRVSVFGAGAIVTQSKVVQVQIESLDGTTKCEISLWTTPQICQTKADKWRKNEWKHLQDIQLASPVSHGEIDVLICSDYYQELLMPQEHRIGEEHQPVGVRTPLGWTLAGRTACLTVDNPGCHVAATPELLADEMMKMMWDDELVGLANKGELLYTAEEKIALHKADVSRARVGERYEVAIPWIDEEPPLQTNRKIAEERLFSLEKRLRNEPQIAKKYQEVMQANLDKGYIKKVHHEEKDDDQAWYLPHFPVVREDKQTTKVRIVYDSAAKYGGLSLNDTMLPGPKLQRDVWDVLLLFRRNPVALVADLTEMFSQIKLAEKDQRYHRLLWRDLDTTKEPEVYQAVRLPFGDRASPFLAQYVVRKHAEENSEHFPMVVPIILEQMYMDDIMASLNTIEEAVKIRQELIEIFGAAGFKIRRWCSNELDVLEGIPPEDCVSDVRIEESELPCMKTLGIQWSAKEDVFMFKLNPPDDFEHTKRGFLKRVAMLFDPLQMLAPFTIRAKMIMQETWLLGLEWDEKFPDHLVKKSREWLTSVADLTGVQVPRCYRDGGKVPVDVSLHTMTDASRLAYAAVTYIRYEYEDGEVSVRFVAAKAKVAPTKAVSIPRLELMAAVLGLRLGDKISTLLDVPQDACTFWTDSMDVVYWIQGQSRRYKTFVANRVAEIHQKSNPNQWRYVPTAENCADDATRGLSADVLTPEHRWFTGPSFLYESADKWPKRKCVDEKESSADCLCELVKMTSTLTATPSQPVIDPLRFSSWTKLCRRVAWVLRCARHWLSKVKVRSIATEEVVTDESRPLLPEEINEAEKVLIRQAQAERFPEEIKSLKEEKAISKQSQLRALNPILDSEGLLRVGGRLQRAAIPFDAKHPVILPKRHHVTRLVITHVHEQSHHMGVNYVHAQVRQKYWIGDGRQEVKRWDRDCKICERRRVQPATQIMAPLPVSRLGKSMRTFSSCCVDYAGPFITKLTRRVSVKRYLCLFTCSATRAVHLEMASSLSTSDFLNAFSRMVATRGKPEEVTSDNGTNFVGAERELRELLEQMDRDKVSNDCANKGIKWNWNPPLGSHFGGVFESLVKVAKRALKAIVGNAGLTDDELQTAIKEVEGLMNSRPLTYEGSDERDEPVLTPNHFLIGQSGGQLAPRVTDEVAFNPKNRWRFIQDLVKTFWRRWRKEYLATLNTRKKWTEVRNNLTVGDVVLVVDQQAARGDWPLGRIEEVFPDDEGRVRVVRVLSRGHSYVRPISRLCPLNVNT